MPQWLNLSIFFCYQGASLLFCVISVSMSSSACQSVSVIHCQCSFSASQYVSVFFCLPVRQCPFLPVSVSMFLSACQCISVPFWWPLCQCPFSQGLCQCHFLSASISVSFSDGQHGSGIFRLSVPWHSSVQHQKASAVISFTSPASPSFSPALGPAMCPDQGWKREPQHEPQQSGSCPLLACRYLQQSPLTHYLSVGGGQCLKGPPSGQLLQELSIHYQHWGRTQE